MVKLNNYVQYLQNQNKKEAARFDRTLRSAHQELEGVKQGSRNLWHQLASTEGERDQSKQDALDFSEKWNKLSHDYEILRQENEGLRGVVENLKATRDASLVAQDRQIADLRCRLLHTPVYDDIKHLRLELAKAIEAKEKLTTDINDLKAGADYSRNRIEELKQSKIMKQYEANSHLIRRIEELQQANQDLTKTKLSLEAQIKIIMDEKTALNTQLKSEVITLQKLEQVAQAGCHVKAAEISNLKAENARLKKSLMLLKGQMDSTTTNAQLNEANHMTCIQAKLQPEPKPQGYYIKYNVPGQQSLFTIMMQYDGRDATQVRAHFESLGCNVRSISRLIPEV